jgi:hypothetical protein
MASLSAVVQFCCGTGDCAAAGVGKRDGFVESQSNTFTSAIFADAEGNLIVPHSVGDESGDKFDIFMEDHGLNASSMVQSRSASGIPIYKIGYAPEAAVEKRACDTFAKDGEPYTKTGRSKSLKTYGYYADASLFR